jgi:multidrug efflux pump
MLAINILPLEQYPDVAPPTIAIKATYTGASAETVENSVVQAIEQGLTGLDGFLYFSSTSSSSESAEISVTFRQGTDPDIAQAQVQNKVDQIRSKLPEAVRQNGLRVAKSQSDILIIAVLYDETDKSSTYDVADYMAGNMQDQLSRIEGVGSLQLFASQYAMRIWLDPNRLHSYSLMPSDIEKAVQEQNVQIAAGKIGEQPAPDGHRLNATVSTRSLLRTPQEFRNIIVKQELNGAVVRLGDVAEVELGSENYGFTTMHNGHPAAALAVKPASGANALATIAAVKSCMAKTGPLLPAGYHIAYYSDTSIFVTHSLTKVVYALLEAIGLVIVVMFLFLGNWRSAIIPVVTIPVVLLGTFAVLAALGYTINTLTLFAMVLAIGLLVDDAIVVVENVERILSEKDASAKEATILTMKEVMNSLMGIAVVLSMVFLPMAFFGGSSGIIYRQFSITIVAAMSLSVFVAVTLTPALCGLLLKPGASHRDDRLRRVIDSVTNKYSKKIQQIIKKPIRWMFSYGAVTLAAVCIYAQLPTGFLPNEDQGWAMALFTLPEGADAERTSRVADEVRRYFNTVEEGNFRSIVTVVGASFFGQGQNVGMAVMDLKDWSNRAGRENGAQAIVDRAYSGLGGVKDARVFPVLPPPIMGLGLADGFELQLQAPPGATRSEFASLKNMFLDSANSSRILRGVRTSNALSAPQLHIDFDREKALAYGLSLPDVYATVNAAWAGTYINDFLDRSRIKKVYMQSVAQYRSRPEDLAVWTVRNGGGEMLPLSEIASTRWIHAPETLERYNGIAAYKITGSPAPGIGSGEALNTVESLADEMGATYSWSGNSLEEKESSGQAMRMYAFSALAIFLCLAALYENWSVPAAVLMVVPLGIFGTVAATWLRGLDNTIYFQIALLATMGLAAKNAIMMVTFMEDGLRDGQPPAQAALCGAMRRLRPILMTSAAFVAGAIPLALSTGVGANSRVAIGTGIVGGTVTATVLTIFFAPLFFVLAHSLLNRERKAGTSKNPEGQHANIGG